MGIQEDPLKQELIESNPEFRALYEEHQRLEQRLEEIRDKSLLSEEDELQEKQIKRQKLHLKDQMELILRSHRGSQVSA